MNEDEFKAKITSSPEWLEGEKDLLETCPVCTLVDLAKKGTNTIDEVKLADDAGKLALKKIESYKDETKGFGIAFIVVMGVLFVNWIWQSRQK